MGSSLGGTHAMEDETILCRDVVVGVFGGGEDLLEVAFVEEASWLVRGGIGYGDHGEEGCDGMLSDGLGVASLLLVLASSAEKGLEEGGEVGGSSAK